MDRTKRISFVTLVGAGVNIILTALKIVAGIFGKSSAMLADGIHSLSDLLSDVIVLVFVKISGKKKDKSHDYGHGKFETFATLIISLMLIFVAFELMYSGVTKIMAVLAGEEVAAPRMIAIWAAVGSIVLKELLFQYTAREGKALDSPMIIANAWHHRSDALSSIGSLVGIAGAMFLGSKFILLDPLAGCLISIFILIMGVKMSVPAVKELLDVSLPDEIEEKIVATAKSVPGVIEFHELKTRQEGPGIILEGHLVLDSNLSLKEAHDISKNVEDAIWAEFGEETQISLHLEPEDDAE